MMMRATLSQGEEMGLEMNESIVAPAHSTVTFELPGNDSSPLEIQLFDVTDRRVLTEYQANIGRTPGEIAINAQELTSGVYIARIVYERTVLTQRILLY